MEKFVCREYDHFDGETFGFIVFASKASAKAYRRKYDDPYNVSISVYDTDVNVPVNIYINQNNPYFTRLERDSYREF